MAAEESHSLDINKRKQQYPLFTPVPGIDQLGQQYNPGQVHPYSSTIVNSWTLEKVQRADKNPINKETRASASSGSPMGKHTKYRGIRSRGGKWVSEVREPRKTNRIWLGTFSTPEMAAAAYDVAVLALKGSEAVLNFPEDVFRYPVPATTAPEDIRKTATAGAEMRRVGGNKAAGEVTSGGDDGGGSGGGGGGGGEKEDEFVDIEAWFDMPNLMNDMARAMMISPPRIATYDDPNECDEDFEEVCKLWSYDD